MTFAATAVSADGTESERALAYFNPEPEATIINVAQGNVLESGDIEITVDAEGPVSEYRVYSKPKMSSGYTLMATSKSPVFVAGKYSLGYNYYVTVVNAETKKESEKVYVIVAGSGSSVDLNVDNVFEGKSFVAADRATATHSGLHSGVTIKYDYSKLTDGDLHYQTGRFSTVASSSSQVFDGIIDLGTGYFLGELIIKDFNPTATTAPYMGTALEIQVYSMGEWTTVVSCATNAEIVAYRVSNTHLAFDLGGVRAEKVRIYIPARLGSNTISISEIECSAVYDTTEYDYSDNLLLGKPFVPTDSALKEVHPDATYDYGYAVITDNSYTPKGGRFSTKSSSSTQHVDATVDLGGVYQLGEFRIFDFNAQAEPNASNPSYLGPSLTVEAYLDGVWTTVLYCERADYAAHRVSPSNAYGAQYLTFDLSGVSAQKLRIYIPTNISGSSISFYEITLSGYKVLVHEHTEGKPIKEKNVAPDCENAGSYESVVYCTTCGAEVSRTAVVVPALGHSYNSVVTLPDCENGGYTTNTCTLCGHNYVSDVTAPLGHTEKVIEGKAATCTENGITDGKVCTVCGKTLVSQTVITAGGHIDGDKDFVCDVCGEDLCTVHTEQIIPAKASTCTEAGLTEGKKCSVCGEILLEQTVTEALGHSYEAVVTAPDCIYGGYTTYTCSLCGDSYVADETAPLGHNYVAVVSAPSCTSGGFTTYTCSVCNDTYVADRVESHGHKWHDATTESPKTCEICGETEGEKLPQSTPETEPDADDTEESAPGKDHDECGGGLAGLWNAIVNFFRGLFGLPKKCVCGDEIQ